MKSKTTTPVFSVVMPMYNVERYVRFAIESVLKQTYKSFELICVNDGCNDLTVDIVRQFDDPRIRIVHQSNMGLSAARNTGIKNAKGEFVAFLDSDDAWQPTKLETHLQHFRNNPKLGVSYSASLFMDEDDELLGIGQFPKISKLSPQDVFCRNPIGNGSAAVMRKRMLLQLAEPKMIDGIYRMTYFDEELRQSEDVEFWLRAMLSTDWEFAGVKEALTLYRVNASGLSANLEKQFNAWKTGVTKNWDINPKFYEKWFSLAAAYQKRYLARRAIQSRQGPTAMKMVKEALSTDYRILFQEPARTSVTIICACLLMLPKGMYTSLEKFAMNANAAQMKRS
ncbi:putative glycosyltransferase EpsJ [Thalassocella blandensis]|nr:putative glycosyltransferase EpsJ [Thalassocella blandensis]